MTDQWVPIEGEINDLTYVKGGSLSALDALPDMPTPDWSQAPDWAQWWCVDTDGTTYWYELEPKIGVGGWWHKEIQPQWVAKDKEIDLALGVDWRQTLQRRPKSEDDNNE
jgi:hypothetical protein